MVVATWWIAGTVTINGAAGSEDVGKGERDVCRLKQSKEVIHV